MNNFEIQNKPKELIIRAGLIISVILTPAISPIKVNAETEIPDAVRLWNQPSHRCARDMDIIQQHIWSSDNEEGDYYDFYCEIVIQTIEESINYKEFTSLIPELINDGKVNTSMVRYIFGLSIKTNKDRMVDIPYTRRRELLITLLSFASPFYNERIKKEIELFAYSRYPLLPQEVMNQK